MSDAAGAPDLPWLTSLVEHEGIPLALRVRPNLDSASNRLKYPFVALISHELARVEGNGLPEADYNDSLLTFDQDVHATIESTGGVLALVETFGGKRNYYAYMSSNVSRNEIVGRLKEKYPQHSLSTRGGADPEWTLYRKYRQRYPW